MESRRQIRWAALLLGVLFMVAMVGRVGAVEPKPSGGQDAAATVKQVQAILSQVWEVMAPWVQWAKSAGRDVFAVVYERASLQGLKRVATEAGRIGFDFFTGRPYQAAYEVARDVPGVGRAVKEVIGEANLRKKAAQEKGEHKEL